PLVRITNRASGHVLYAKTHDHSSMGVATGNAIVSTQFDIPAAIEDGLSDIEVVANGLASKKVPILIADDTANFSFPDGGGVSFVTTGTHRKAVAGYARIVPDQGGTNPSGLTIFGFRQNDVLVSEASAPASPLIQSGRIYAEMDRRVNTGLALANPNSEAALVTFFFTNHNRD